MLAYEKNLKGITIYRDRSREGQPMSTGQAAPQTAAVEKKPETKINTAQTRQAHYRCYREG